MDQAVVGTSAPRQDLPDKLTGQAKFTSDIKLPGMLFGKILRSPYPHARSIEAMEYIARVRGLEAGVAYAEAFHLVRRVEP